MKTFWLSFCNDDLPAGRKFLGVIIVQAENFGAALKKTYVLGINPGGEVLACDVTDGHHRIKPDFFDRLLTQEETGGTTYLIDIN